MDRVVLMVVMVSLIVEDVSQSRLRCEGKREREASKSPPVSRCDFWRRLGKAAECGTALYRYDIPAVVLVINSLFLYEKLCWSNEVFWNNNDSLCMQKSSVVGAKVRKRQAKNNSRAQDRTSFHRRLHQSLSVLPSHAASHRTQL